MRAVVEGVLASQRGRAASSLTAVVRPNSGDGGATSRSAAATSRAAICEIVRSSSRE